jgi:hypothetical protein
MKPPDITAQRAEFEQAAAAAQAEHREVRHQAPRRPVSSAQAERGVPRVDLIPVPARGCPRVPWVDRPSALGRRLTDRVSGAGAGKHDQSGGDGRRSRPRPSFGR